MYQRRAARADSVDRLRVLWVIGILGLWKMTGPTRLELATSGVTGRRSNRLNYDPVLLGQEPRSVPYIPAPCNPALRFRPPGSVEAAGKMSFYGRRRTGGVAWRVPVRLRLARFGASAAGQSPPACC